MSTDDEITLFQNRDVLSIPATAQPLVTGYEIAVLSALENETHGLSVSELVATLDGRLKSASAGVTCRRMFNKKLLVKRNGRSGNSGRTVKRKPRLVYAISESGISSLSYWTLRADNEIK